MSHKADRKAFVGKGFTHHVVDRGNCAVAGFTSEADAVANATARNKKAEAFGLTNGYTVQPASEAVYPEE